MQDIRHTFYWGGWITGPFKLELTPTVIVRSGTPFNITTGLDLNNDTLYTERPLRIFKDFPENPESHTIYRG